jgi:hypothetical protein
MEISQRALITALHGMLFGGFFLMAIFGLLVELCRSTWATQPTELTSGGRSLERLYLILMVSVGWAAVLLGAYVVYPWYRAIPPAGVTDLALYPQRFLLSSPATSGWHSIGMEWKEHVAWMAPIAITMAAWVLPNQRAAVRKYPQIRRAVLAFALVAFLAAGLASFLGAMIDKAAPVNGGSTIHLMAGSK